MPYANLAEYFESQASLHSEKIALEFQQQTLNYRELNTRANQMAHYLQQYYKNSYGQFLKPDTFIAICLSTSLDAITALLAIIKTGAAYVPIDPDYPAERIKFILEDIKAPIVITTKELNETKPDMFSEYNTLILETILTNSKIKSSINPIREVTEDHLSYVIYTSGTTGNPKGVLITNKGIINVISQSISLFELNINSRLLQLSSLSFDASVYEIWLTLCCGGTLCIPRVHRKALVGDNLSQELQYYRITTFGATPSLMNTIIDWELSHLETIILWAESASETLVKNWINRVKKIINGYGPSEATILTLSHQYTKHSLPRTIGTPISNSYVYILNDAMQPVLPGEIGEIYIGGVGVARGYLNQPTLSAEKFVVDPFVKNEKNLLYRTGDLARYLVDGNIEFCGRRDDQVKLRGYRIELEEIRNAILQQDDIKECIVDLKSIDINSFLVGYLQLSLSADQSNAFITILRQNLSNLLPDYMIPSHFIFIKEIPKTINGKIDRYALPMPVVQQEQNFLQSDNKLNLSIEDKLKQIWSNQLNIDFNKINPEANFFDLGGHSLLLVEINKKIHEKLGLKLNLIDLFKYPTTRSLAQFIKGTSSDTVQNNIDQSILRQQKRQNHLRERKRVQID